MSGASHHVFDDALQEELNRIVFAAEKRTRGFIPAPSHLRSLMNSSLHPAEATSGPRSNSPLDPSTVPTTGGSALNQPVCSSPSASGEQIRRDAVAACLAAVPRFEPWLARVDHGIAAADAAEDKVEGIKCRVDTLLNITAEVRRHSDALSTNASALMARKAKLERTLTSVAGAMKHFNRVDALLAEVSHPGLSASSARFPLLLEELEDTAVYLARVHRYKSAKMYSGRLSLAYQRAMLCLRDAIVNRFRETAAIITSGAAYAGLFAHSSNIPGSASSSGAAPLKLGAAAPAADMLRPSTLEAALAGINEEFATQLMPIEGLLRLLEARCTAAEAEMFVANVFSAYAEARSRVVSPLLADYGEAAPVAHNAPLGAKERAAMALLMRNLKAALAEEKRMFERVWLSDNIPTSAFDSIASDIADASYQQFRAALLKTDELEELCALCASLIDNGASRTHSATHASLIGTESGAANVGALIVKRMIQDTQERIVFRTSVYIRSKVAPFQYSASQLWQQCVTAVDGANKFAAATAAATETATPLTVTDADGSMIPVPSGAPSPASPLTPNTAADPDVFVPVERCVELLNLLYPAVERGVFAVFADECIHAAVDGLLRGAKLINEHGNVEEARIPVASRRGQLYSSLFLVRHMLRLRESLTPFDVNLTVTEKGLNLSSLAERKLEVFQRSRESKRDVEAELRAACESALNVMVKTITHPLHLAASPDRFPSTASEAAVVDCVEDASMQACEIASQLKLVLSCFISAQATRVVLWKPVKSQVLGAYAALEKQALTRFADFAPSSATTAALDAI